jgi:hypothetical protein
VRKKRYFLAGGGVPSYGDIFSRRGGVVSCCMIVFFIMQNHFLVVRGDFHALNGCFFVLQLHFFVTHDHFHIIQYGMRYSSLRVLPATW